MLDFNVSPYYDDFDHKKHFHRILFRPGRNIQARELTQMQSMLQDQVSKFANHMFNQNTPITGGKLTFNTKSDAVEVDYKHNFDEGEEILNIDDFKNGIVVGSSGAATSVNAKVIAITEPVFDDGGTVSLKPTMVLRYNTDTKFKVNDTVYLYESSVRAHVTKVKKVVTASISDGVYYIVNGQSYSLTQNPDGTYEKYILGHFVSVDAQTIIASTDTDTPNIMIGLAISEKIIDYVDDASLLDPALGSSNYQAPGADRYTIQLTLESRPLVSTNDNFIELLRIKDGEIIKRFDSTSYKEIDDYIAKRTYETNGDFIVNNFKIRAKPSPDDDDKFLLEFSSGVAYVGGYRVENKSTTISVDKSRQINTKDNSLINISYGNYFKLSSITHYPKLDTFNDFGLYIDNSAVEKIGTAKVRGLSNNGTFYILSVFDVKFESKSGKVTGGGTGGYSFTNLTITIDYSGCVVIINGKNYILSKKINELINTYNITDINGNSVTSSINNNTTYTLNFSGNDVNYIKSDYTDNSFDCTVNSRYKGLNSAENSKLLFSPLDNVIGKTFGDIKYSSFTKYPNQNASDNAITISTVSLTISASPIPIDSDTKSENFIIFGSDGTNVTSKVVIVYDNNSVSITGDNLNGLFDVYIREEKLRSPITKTYVTYDGNTLGPKTHEGIHDLYDDGVTWDFYENAGVVVLKKIKPSIVNSTINLYVADIISIKKICIISSSGNFDTGTINNADDIKNKFSFDNGQTDNYYDYGKITKKQNTTIENITDNDSLVIVFDYFKPDSPATQGFFSVGSYKNLSDKSLIPTYKNKKGESFNLMSTLDFRPVKKPGDKSNTFYDNISIPINNSALLYASYEYYMPRKDLIELTKNKTFNIKQGTPATNPIFSKQSSGSLLLGKMTVGAYTFDMNDIFIEPVYHKRWTMEDISNLNTRITNLEYYTSLSLLEQQTKNLQITDKQGNNRFQHGFFVDDFSNFKSADFENSDFSACINTRSNKLTAIQDVKKLTLKPNPDPKSSLYNDVGLSRIYHLPPSSGETLIDNTTTSTSTSSAQITPESVAPLEGIFAVSPPMDNWIDYDIEPSVTNIDPSLVGFNINDSVNSLHLSDWKSIVGVELTPSSLTEITQSTSKNKYGTTSIFGNFLKYDNIQPYIRPQQLLLKCEGLKVDTNIKVMFDGVNVSNYVYSLNKIKLSSELDSSLYKTVYTDSDSNYCVYSGYTHYMNASNGIDKTPDFSEYNTGRIASTLTTPSIIRRWCHYTDLERTNFVNKHAIWNNTNSGEIVINKQITVTPGKKYKLKYLTHQINQTKASITWDGISISTSVDVDDKILNKDINPQLSTYNLYAKFENTTSTGYPFIAIELTDDDTGSIVYSSSRETCGDTVDNCDYGGYYTSTSTIVLDENNTYDTPNALQGKLISVRSTEINTSDNGELKKTTTITTAKISTHEGNILTLDGKIGVSVGYNSKFGDITSTYSIITNKASSSGVFLGVLNIPADTFKSGEKSIKLLNNYNKLLADTTFHASPLIQKAIWKTSSPSVSGYFDTFSEIKYKKTTVDDDIYDPLAQTFEIPENKYPNGVFVKNLVLYFDQVPKSSSSSTNYVSIKFTETNSGIPSGNIIDYSVVTKYGIAAATGIAFQFGAPVYLKPGVYALIIESNNSDYKLNSIKYAETDEKNKDPLLGNLFLPQNAADWVGSTNTALKMKMDIYTFDTNASTSILFNVNKKLPNKKTLDDDILPMELISAHNDSFNYDDLEIHSMNITSTDYVPPGCSLDYSCKTKTVNTTDTSSISVVTGKYGSPKENDIYKNDSIIRKVYTNTEDSFVLTANLSTNNKYVSPMVCDDGLGVFISQHKINNLGLQETIIVLNSPIEVSSKPEIQIIRNNNDPAGDNAKAEPIMDGTNTLTRISITSGGSGYINPPTIKYIINNTSETINDITIPTELSPSGGNADCKYITKSIILSENNVSKDLKVYCTAYRPIGTNILMFYKCRSKDDSSSITANPWNLMYMTSNKTAYSSNRDTVYEYEYSIGSQGTESMSYKNSAGKEYQDFIEYSIKVVLITNNKNFVPYLNDLRAIALPSYE